MEDFLQFIGILFVVFGILQIILFFKVWGMTNDMKRTADNVESLIRNSNITTKHLCKDEYIRSCGYTLESKGITYTLDEYKIKFSDGVQGEIKYLDGRVAIITDDSYALIYYNLDYATCALHEYLTSRKQLGRGLFDKIKHDTGKEK